VSKIAFKLPLSAELLEALRDMSDSDAGAAIKAALAYQAGEAPGELTAAAYGAYEQIRRLIDLSRKRANAGRAGGDRKRLDEFAASKPQFAASKTQIVADKPQEVRESEPPQQIDDTDIMDVLSAFT